MRDGCVLIVHDELGVRLGLGEFLATNGYRVLSATTGQAALAILEEDVPVLLVIGVGMPLMSGWKLIEALAHYPDLSRIPRLLVGPEVELGAICGKALAVLEKQGATEGTTDLAAAGADLARRRVASA
jgi:CheY-like chemotaxis protein